MATSAQSKPQRYDLDRVIRLLISAGTLVVVVCLLRYLSDVLLPFALALLIAYLLNPVVNVVEAWLKNRAAAVLVTVFGSLGLIAAAIILAVPLMTSQLHEFEALLVELREGAEREIAGVTEGKLSLAQSFDALIERQSDQRVRWFLEKVRETVSSEEFDLEARVMALLQTLAPGVWGVVSGAVSFILGLTGLVVVLLYVVFLLNDFRLVEESWKEQLPPVYREPVVQFLEEFRVAMSRYFRGQFVVAACVGVLFAIGFSLIGLRMGILLGLFVGLLNMVPYLQTVGIIPAAILAVLRAVEGDTSVMVSLLLTLGVFVVVQLIQDSLLTPRIVGKATGLRPAIILLGVFVWGKVLGFLGLVLAIPLTCLGLAYYRRWVLKLQDVRVIGEDQTQGRRDEGT
ncbi:MAG: AI-2E family transporter [Phycisphaerae bacterium]